MFQQTKKQQTAQTTSIPAPVKGLNSKDAIASMGPDFALSLDNIFCKPTSVDIRNGSLTWATGLGAWVETIAHYSSPIANKQFSAAGSSIFDTTSGGAVGAAVVSGQSNARWQYANFSTPAGAYLYMVNGANSPQLYNGSGWQAVTNISSPIAITGVTVANLVHVNVFKNRLWFVEKDTMNAWYLPLNSIGGAANVFPLGSLFVLGGSLTAMMTWTIDNVNGVDDYAVFITSEGEGAIYQGYDPSFASTFTLVGLFRAGRPIGRRCFTKMGSDNVVLCADGVIVLSKELTTDRNQSQSLSYNIQNTINDDIASYKDNFGWQPVYYPLGNKLIINVPQTENNFQYQYIMNTITGAWSSWNKENNGFNATCWDILEDVLYFGGNGTVVIADYGTADDTNAIGWDIKPAFSYFGDLGSQKYFTYVRPIISSTDNLSLSYILCTDYNNLFPSSPPLSVSMASAWDVSPWDVTPWGGTETINRDWLAVGGIGYAAALRIAGKTQGMGASLQSIDYVYEKGGVL